MNLREKISGGQKIVGTMIHVVRNPALPVIAKNAGLDFIMYDCEHSNFSFETLHDAFLTANAVGIAGFARVPVGTKDYISRALDAGAAGVMVPMIETAEYARQLVKYAKYQPVGDRGYTSAAANTGYKRGVHTEIMEEANSRITAIAQIETKTAIENIDEIAAVEGLDALLIGPNDLSLSLGVPGDLAHPLQLEAMSKVAAACEKHEKAFGMHAEAKLLQKFADSLGIIMSLRDTDMLSSGFAAIAALKDGLRPAD